MQVKKHIKQWQGHEGGIFTVEAPLHVSNVQIVDPVTQYEYYKKKKKTIHCSLMIYGCCFNKMIVIVYVFDRQPCKVGIRYKEDGTKVRIARGIGASGAIIPRPEILKIRTTPRPTIGNIIYV